VLGSLLGSLILSILTTGLILLRIDPVLQDFVIGVIIVAAVGIDQLRRRRMFRSVGTR
jgi:ribose/xylose/arabinose/galactoside ABC-type transport system permease subunit